MKEFLIYLGISVFWGFVIGLSFWPGLSATIVTILTFRFYQGLLKKS